MKRPDDKGDLRWCSECNDYVPKTEFYKKTSTKGGLDYFCKTHRKQITERYHERFRERNREKLRKLSAENNAKRKQRMDSDDDFRSLQKAAQLIWRLKKKYGITKEQYDEMLTEQGGTCAICRETQPVDPEKWLDLCVDHDHKTGKVRGLLCLRCNAGLGNFRDRPELLEAAAEYLLKTAAQFLLT